MSNFSDATVLITGGTGSIGGEILSHVLKHDVKKVVVFSRDEIKHFMLRHKYRDPRLVSVVGDIRNKQSIEKAFLKHLPDIVYHAAAMKHVDMCEEFPTETAYTNIIGTQNVVDAAYNTDTDTLVTISTDKSVSPVNVLGATKLVAERITLNADYTCVRFGNVACTRGSVIPVFVENIRNGLPLMITNMGVSRFLIEKEDAVRLVMKATQLSNGNDIFILKMKAFDMYLLADVFYSKYGAKFSVTGLKPGERLHEDLLHETEYDIVTSMEDFYVLSGAVGMNTCISGSQQKSMNKYSSKNAPKFEREELERIIDNYIKSEGIVL